MKWSVPQTQTKPSGQQQGQTLDNLFTGIVHLGNTNNPQDKANLDQLLHASSVVIPLQNLQIQDTHVNNKVPSVENVNISISNDTNIVHPSESRQNPVRRTQTVPFRFPTSNTAIYIPTSLLSRIRRQTPRGFLVLMNPNNNQTSANTARLQIANMNNGSVLVLARRPSANSQTPAVSRISHTRPVQIQGVINQPIISRAIRLSASPRQHSNSVRSNNSPSNTQRSLNQLRRNTQIRPLTQSHNRNRRQPVQPRQQTQQQQTQRTVLHTGATRPHQTIGRSGQISGIVSRNGPIVQNGMVPRTFSRNGIVPRTQSLRTGQTGQMLRDRSQTAPVQAPTTQRRPAAPRAPTVRRRPPTPRDPFSRRFSAGFLRGSNFLVQPPLDNVTFFNADGSRVNIDTDINGNTIRRVAIPPAGARRPLIPQTLGNSLFRGGPVFGGLGGGLTGGFGGGLTGGFGGGVGGFGGIF